MFVSIGLAKIGEEARLNRVTPSHPETPSPSHISLLIQVMQLTLVLGLYLGNFRQVSELASYCMEVERRTWLLQPQPPIVNLSKLNLAGSCQAFDGLKCSWKTLAVPFGHNRVYLNPPWSQLDCWLEKVGFFSIHF